MQSDKTYTLVISGCKDKRDLQTCGSIQLIADQHTRDLPTVKMNTYQNPVVLRPMKIKSVWTDRRLTDCRDKWTSGDKILTHCWNE